MNQITSDDFTEEQEKQICNFHDSTCKACIDPCDGGDFFCAGSPALYKYCKSNHGKTSKFFNSDALETPIPNDSITLIVTSPPYNVGIEYATHSDNMAYDEYIKWLTDVFTFLKDKLVEGGRLCINIAPTGISNFAPIHHDLITSLRENGYRFVGEILWYKQNIRSRTAWGSFCSPSSPYVLPSWEYVYILQKGTKLIEDKISDITSKEFVKFTDAFWDIKPETKKRGHPVPFPEELVYRLIKLYSYPGDVIYDPFGGSGTVALVTRKTNRISYYNDISSEYLEIAQKRIFGSTTECPRCKSRNTVKDGHQQWGGQTYQKYRCKECRMRFSPRSKDSDIVFQVRNPTEERIEKALEDNREGRL